jgi:hypothetical protein
MRTECWSVDLKGREHSEDPGVDVRVILKWISRKWGRRLWTGFVWLRIETGGTPLLTSGSMNGKEFLD